MKTLKILSLLGAAQFAFLSSHVNADGTNYKYNGSFNKPLITIAGSTKKNIPGWNRFDISGLGQHIGNVVVNQVNGYNWLTVNSHDLSKSLTTLDNWCERTFDGTKVPEYVCRKSEISFNPLTTNNTGTTGWNKNQSIGTEGSTMWFGYGFKIKQMFGETDCYYKAPNSTYTDKRDDRCFAYISQFHTQTGSIAASNSAELKAENSGISPILGLKIMNNDDDDNPSHPGAYQLVFDTKLCTDPLNCTEATKSQINLGVARGLELNTRYDVKMKVLWASTNGEVEMYIKGGIFNGWTKFREFNHCGTGANVDQPTCSGSVYPMVGSGLQTFTGGLRKSLQMGLYWGGLKAQKFAPKTNRIMEVEFDVVTVSDQDFQSLINH
jgi:hypothetical protein